MPEYRYISEDFSREIALINIVMLFRRKNGNTTTGCIIMTESLMSQAIDLTVVGMGFVFVFLIVLIGATTLMSKIAMKLEPPAPEVPAAPAQPATPMNDPQLMAVISAAVAKYRSRP